MTELAHELAYELELSSSIGWIILVLLSNLVTARFSLLLPWSEVAKNVRMPMFFGIALAPFLLGFVVILPLKILPQYSQQTHIVFIFIALFLLAFALYLSSFFIKYLSWYSLSGIRHPYALHEKIAITLFLSFTLLMAINVIVFPLTQADALEYAQMGRIIFDTGTLSSYPPIIANNHSSGFYSSVTHPPLYVALIYASYLLQGNADMPFLMRFISPWLLIASAGLIFTIGSRINRCTGIFAAVIFISTPLLFMGAATSLIDPLSVLGFCLVFMSIFSFSRISRIRLGLLQGCVLGIALWTHSQAVLFPFLLFAGLFAYNGIGKWRQSIKQILGVITTSVLIGIWPYLDNYGKFGAFISDNPLIFRLKNLAWDDYFLIGRGVDGITAQIQYGLLKGWFTPEAYGFSFWLITAGIFWLAKPSASKIYQMLMGKSDSQKRVLFVALIIVLAYHAGVVLAIMFGVNQMFRIERYMLILLPCISLLAGFVFSNCFDLRGKIKLRRIFSYSVIILLFLQLTVFSLQLFRGTNYNLKTMLQGQEQLLNTQPQQQVIRFIRDDLPKNSLVLATLSSDMYYADKKMISNLDPSLIDFYQVSIAKQGWKILKELGVTHIYVVANAQPTFYNSTLQDIVSDNSFTELLYSAGGNQLYSLNPEIVQKTPAVGLDLMPPNVEWERTENILIGGRKSLEKINFSSENMNDKIYSETKLPFSFFQRDVSTSLQTKLPIYVNDEGEYKLEFDLEGYGLLRFWLTQYDEQGQIVEKTYLLSETILSEQYRKRNSAYRFKTVPNMKYLQIEIEHYGNSQVAVTKCLLSKL